MVKIAEDSLFECLEDNERKDSPRDASKIIRSIKDWRSWMHELARSYGEPESYHVLIDDSYPDYIMEMLGNDFGLSVSQPGEIEDLIENGQYLNKNNMNDKFEILDSRLDEEIGEIATRKEWYIRAYNSMTSADKDEIVVGCDDKGQEKYAEAGDKRWIFDSDWDVVANCWDTVTFSEPGEVEYENICKKIAKTMQHGDKTTVIARDRDTDNKIICISQNDGLPDCITKYDSWKECFVYVFYSQLKDDINDLGLAEVFGLEREQYPINKEYLTKEDFTFLNKDDPDMFTEWNFSPFDLKNDLDKRRDFCNLDENEFLKTYSYIGGEDYEITELLNPELAKERDIMLSGKMEDVKLDYLFNKHHIHDYQDRAITLADIQNKDFKDIQLQINSPVLERGTNITIVAEDLDDFIKCIDAWANDFDATDFCEKMKEYGACVDLEDALNDFNTDLTKWKEQSREYAELTDCQHLGLKARLKNRTKDPNVDLGRGRARVQTEHPEGEQGLEKEEKVELSQNKYR